MVAQSLSLVEVTVAIYNGAFRLVTPPLSHFEVTVAIYNGPFLLVANRHSGSPL